MKKWKEAIEQQKSKRKRDDGDDVKKEEGGKKVKTEGKFVCLRVTSPLTARFISCSFSSTNYAGRVEGRWQAEEGR